jgi:hypothetical protein
MRDSSTASRFDPPDLDARAEVAGVEVAAHL